MLYISGIDKQNQMFYVTDTDDCSTDVFTLDMIKKSKKLGLEIQGVDGTRISVYNATKKIIQDKFDEIKQVVSDRVNTFSIMDCEIFGRAGGYKRKIQALGDDVEAARKMVLDRMLPTDLVDNIRNSCVEYTNDIQYVKTRFMQQEEIKEILKNNLCLCVQYGSKSNVTSFICTASLGIIDNIYGKGYFDNFFLTREMGYVRDGWSKIVEGKQRQTDNTEDKSNLLKVFSGSLRFREKYPNSIEKVLSSCYYTVNTDNLIALYILKNPNTMQKYNVINEYTNASNKDVYEFNLDLWNLCNNVILSNVSTFGTDEILAQVLELPTEARQKVVF